MEKTIIKIQGMPFVCSQRNVEHWANSMQWLLMTTTLHSSHSLFPCSTGEEMIEKIMDKYKSKKKEGLGEKCF